MAERPDALFKFLAVLRPGPLDVREGEFHQGQRDKHDDGCKGDERNHKLCDLHVLHRDASEHYSGDKVRGDRGADRVGGPADGQPLDGLRAFHVTGHEIRIDDNLKDCGRGSDHERAQKEDQEPSRER